MMARAEEAPAQVLMQMTKRLGIGWRPLRESTACETHVFINS